MVHRKPAEHILSEVTRLGSSLAELATSELGVVLDDLRGPHGDTDDKRSEDDIDHGRVNVGTLAVNAMQLLSKVGDMMVQLSKYDLIRNDIPHVSLQAANPISSYSISASKEQRFEFLIENAGDRDQTIKMSAELKDALGKSKAGLVFSPRQQLTTIRAAERRRVALKLRGPSPAPGRYDLRITITGKPDKRPRNAPRKPPLVLARKTIQVNVLPLPQSNKP